MLGISFPLQRESCPETSRAAGTRCCGTNQTSSWSLGFLTCFAEDTVIPRLHDFSTKYMHDTCDLHLSILAHIVNDFGMFWAFFEYLQKYAHHDDCFKTAILGQVSPEAQHGKSPLPH